MDAIIRVPSGSDLVPVSVLVAGVISRLEDWPELCEKILPNLIEPENSDVDLSSWRILTMWTIIRTILSEDPDLRGFVATLERFKENVRHFGEENFSELLRDVEKNKDWHRLLENGTFLNSIAAMTLIYGLEVFFVISMPESTVEQPEPTKFGMSFPQAFKLDVISMTHGPWQ